MPFGFTSQAIVPALVDYAEELEDAEELSGIVYLKTLRDAAKVKIEGGTASEFVSTTVNGQSFTREIQVSAVEMFDAASQALRIVKGEQVKITYPMFGSIPH